jgi:hypothetical protein
MPLFSLQNKYLKISHLIVNIPFNANASSVAPLPEMLLPLRSNSLMLRLVRREKQMHFNSVSLCDEYQPKAVA